MVLLHTQQTIKYLRVAPAAIWALDYILTLEHEIHLFSTTSCWSLAIVMFILARYAPVVWIISEIYVTLGRHSVETCLTSYQASGASLLLIMLAAEGLLLMRILALWHNNRKIKLFLLASYLLMVICMFICDVLAEFLLRSVCVPASTLSVLEAATEVERLVMGKFISAALFELAVITLTIYHSIQLRSNGIRSIGILASTLLKGSLLYALSLLAISVVNIVSLALPVSWQGEGGIVDVFQGVLHGVLASRILFDLRDLGNTSQDDSEAPSYLFTSYISLPRTQCVSQLETIPMTVLHAESNT
ncbi:hypothetical protein DFJ58DRAFT_817302 [Suillus subalutaceus]|uniref:uncharacterized protein n=1 Tax=Suillus subalutaceus TaxID=48586 RepID=UPI001B881C1D|nr:uncharacterized protein DFJ58DRAFT_817302 [Suillus subalutaceus]KAG1836877.1 hypothetical protein DFJ58DRAFT_817302 [Suillus subalutaceus]